MIKVGAVINGAIDYAEHPLISVPKLVTDDSCIDIDSLYAVVRDQVSRAPVTVSVAKASITLLPQDIDQLYTYIKENNDEG